MKESKNKSAGKIRRHFCAGQGRKLCAEPGGIVSSGQNGDLSKYYASNAFLNGWRNGKNGRAKRNGLQNGLINNRERFFKNGLTKVNGLLNGREKFWTNGLSFLNGSRTKPNGFSVRRNSLMNILILQGVICALLAIIFTPAFWEVSQKIYVDGYFEDWLDVKSNHDDIYDVANPHINIVEYKANLTSKRLSFYLKTYDEMFVGTETENEYIADVLRIFVDLDNNLQSGYLAKSAAYVGADFMIEIAGLKREIRKAVVCAFSGMDRYDWNNWSFYGNVRTALEGNTVELSCFVFYDHSYSAQYFIHFSSADTEDSTPVTTLSGRTISLQPEHVHRPGLAQNFTGGITIDGLFEDWQNINATVDKDDSVIPNPSLDILETKFSLAEQDKLAVYLKTRGLILEGTLIPVGQLKYLKPTDTGKDTARVHQHQPTLNDMDNDGTPDEIDDDIDGDGIPNVFDLNPYDASITTKRPPKPPYSALRGEDKILIYIDSDRSKGTGNTTLSIGADIFLYITGKYGMVLTSELFSHNNGSWTKIANLSAMCNGQEIEARINFSSSKTPLIYYVLKNWADEQIDTCLSEELSVSHRDKEGNYKNRFWSLPVPEPLADPPLAELASGTGAQAGDKFGFNVSWAGDFNKDGYSDVIVGAPYVDVPGFVATSNPSTGDDSAYSIAVDSNYIYIAGWDYSPGNYEWRIEKRDKTTGASVTAFDGDGVVVSDPSTGTDAALSIAVDSNYIYVAGYDESPGNREWRIEKRDINTGALVTAFDGDGVVVSNPSSGSDAAYSIAVDSSYIYIAGRDEYPGTGNFEWRIEKRDINTGALVTAFDSDGIVVSNPSTGEDTASSIAADSSYIYIAGIDYSPGNYEWRIEKRDINTGALVTAFDSDGVVVSNPSTGVDAATSIAVDSNYIYIAGYDYSPGDYEWRIEKRDINTGALVTAFDGDGVVVSNPSTGTDIARSIAVDSNYIYIAGYDYSPGNYEWRIEKRDINTGALVTAFDGDGVVVSNPSGGGDAAYSIAVDSSYIYSAGVDQGPGTNFEWHIEKRHIQTGGIHGVDCGAAYIFYGYQGMNSAHIDAVNANVTIYGTGAGDNFGWSVSDAGDLNNDGYGDVIIGAPNAAPRAFGLRATYYDNWAFTTPVVTKTDEQIFFDWGSNIKPVGELTDADTFSVIWEGKIFLDFDEAYTFYLYVDEAAQLIVDDKILIDTFFTTAGETASDPKVVYIFPDTKHANDNTGDTIGDAQRNDISGASPTAITADDGWYTADAAGSGKNVLYFSTFNLGALPSDKTITGAELQVLFSVEAGYDGTNPIRYDNGAGLTTTGIIPADGNTDRFATFDLFGAGVDTISELRNLDIEFTNADTGAVDTEYDAVSFNFVRIKVTFDKPVVAKSGYHDIKVMYKENTGAAVCQLRWSSESVKKAVVPITKLSNPNPPGDGNRTGAAYIFYGWNAQDYVTSAANANITIFGSYENQRFGHAVSTGGNIADNDAVIIGAYGRFIEKTYTFTNSPEYFALEYNKTNADIGWDPPNKRVNVKINRIFPLGQYEIFTKPLSARFTPTAGDWAVSLRWQITDAPHYHEAAPLFLAPAWTEDIRWIDPVVRFYYSSVDGAAHNDDIYGVQYISHGGAIRLDSSFTQTATTPPIYRFTVSYTLSTTTLKFEIYDETNGVVKLQKTYKIGTALNDGFLFDKVGIGVYASGQYESNTGAAWVDDIKVQFTPAPQTFVFYRKRVSEFYPEYVDAGCLDTSVNTTFGNAISNCNPNGDSYDDVIVGAPAKDKAFVYNGAPKQVYTNATPFPMVYELGIQPYSKLCTDNLISVSMANSTAGFAVGDRGRVLNYSSYPKNWHVIAGPSADMLYGVDCIPGLALVVGNLSTNGKIYRSIDMGRTWTDVTPASPPARYYNVTVETATRTWAVGSGGRINYSTDGGGSWTQQGSGVTTADLYGIKVDGSNGVAVGNGVILYTTNGGTNWYASTDADIGSYKYYSTNVSGTKAWVVGENGRILYNSDISAANGGDWTVVSSGTTQTLKSICMLNATYGFIVGTGGVILKYENNAWSLENSPTKTNLNSISLADNCTGFAVGEGGEIVIYGALTRTGRLQNYTHAQSATDKNNYAFLAETKTFFSYPPNQEFVADCNGWRLSRYSADTWDISGGIDTTDGLPAGSFKGYIGRYNTVTSGTGTVTLYTYFDYNLPQPSTATFALDYKVVTWNPVSGFTNQFVVKIINPNGVENTVTTVPLSGATGWIRDVRLNLNTAIFSVPGRYELRIAADISAASGSATKTQINFDNIRLNITLNDYHYESEFITTYVPKGTNQTCYELQIRYAVSGEGCNLYIRTPTGWKLITTLTATTFSQFTYRLNSSEISNNTVRIMYKDAGADPDTTIDYIRIEYHRIRSTLVLTDVATLSGTAGTQFGFAVSNLTSVNADSYDDIIVGAPATTNGNAYIYFGGATFDTTPDVTLTGSSAGDKFGFSVSWAGDVNNDGIGDVIVGAPYNNSASGSVADAGAIYVFFGSASIAASISAGSADCIKYGENANDHFGWAVCAAGDMNKGGLDDVVVGAPDYDTPGADAGKTYVFRIPEVMGLCIPIVVYTAPLIIVFISKRKTKRKRTKKRERW